MLLDSKTAVVYGGGGAIGGAVARAFAEQGAHVIFAGRTSRRSSGVRAVCIRSAGSPDAPGVDAALVALAEEEGISRDAFEARIAERTLLKHIPRLHEIANVAVLAACDLASSVTGVIANGTCGEATD